MRLPSFLIKMDDVFESYARKFMQSNLAFDSFRILDGNHQPPIGAAKYLFDDDGVLGNREATPDIVITRDGMPISVLEVKYKPCPGNPDRDHLNQVMTYAVTYKVKHATLVYPSKKSQSTNLAYLGIVDGIKCFKATVDLSCENLLDQEDQISRLIAESLPLPL